MVNEDLLSVLWQNVLFSVETLETTAGESIIIKRAGTINTHAGPDFSLAHVTIGDINWCGDVEIHTKASDWNKHKHSTDAAYESVILHVVYEADADVTRSDGTAIPILELKGRILEHHLQTYRYLMDANTVVPCAQLFPNVKPIVVEQMKQRVLVERLERKTESLFQELKDQPHWKMIAGRLIFKSFGTGLNDFLFERMAAHIDFNKLDRLSYAQHSVEAMFFGMAGILDKGFVDSYPLSLANEFQYLKRVLSIDAVVDYSEWKFLRTRPSNFPTIRLAQLAAVFSNPDWFQTFVTLKEYKEAQQFLNKPIHPYWNTHYRFDTDAPVLVKIAGKSFVNIFLLNASVSYLALKARYYKSEEIWDDVFTFIDSIKAEDNVITRKWLGLGMKMKSGFDSQSSIELYKMYCTHKKCLSCSIGYSILRHGSVPVGIQ